MQKYLLDGNIFDEILSSLKIQRKLRQLCCAGAISLIGTWIEAGEIDAMSTSKPEKQLAISELIAELGIARVPVAGLILDHSKIGETSLIDWGETALLGASLKPSGTNQNDMAIAMTAKIEGAILVTNDLEMQKKAKTIIKVQVMDWLEFASECQAMNIV